jgi:hypothetical protein
VLGYSEVLVEARSRDAHRPSTDDVEVAALIAQYTAQQLTSVGRRGQRRTDSISLA